MRIEKLLTAMMEYDHGDVPRIQHFVKVYEFARMIGLMEGLDSKTQFTLESAAVVHDIGIHISEQKYGSSSGKYQELEGPAEAKKLLECHDCLIGEVAEALGFTDQFYFSKVFKNAVGCTPREYRKQFLV